MRRARVPGAGGRRPARRPRATAATAADADAEGSGVDWFRLPTGSRVRHDRESRRPRRARSSSASAAAGVFFFGWELGLSNTSENAMGTAEREDETGTESEIEQGGLGGPVANQLLVRSFPRSRSAVPRVLSR